jgi:hypothetical protein
VVAIQPLDGDPDLDSQDYVSELDVRSIINNVDDPQQFLLSLRKTLAFWYNEYHTASKIQDMRLLIRSKLDAVFVDRLANTMETQYGRFCDFFEDWSEAKQFLRTVSWRPNASLEVAEFKGHWTPRSPTHGQDPDYIQDQFGNPMEFLCPAPCYVRMLYEAITSFYGILDKVDASGKLNKLIQERYSPQYIEAVCWKIFVSLISEVFIITY